ncbi:MAG: hypothetical protein A2W09_00315 [Deltaproteobacteria bacterium RBG_16_50_11]|nr:MAG: hypothetical protein A2W09_00315 [Deltaproteobacteria bacterium RBG_16_50_11]
MLTTNPIRLFVFATLILALLAGTILASQEAVGQAAASLTRIKVSFKLDPSITRGMYMGERWVSPPTYTAAGEGKEITMEASAQGLDAKGKPIDISPEWIPEDPKMVAVSPGQGRQVKITVREAGQSSLKVAAQGLSRKLLIKATYQDGATQVEISQ